MLLDVVFLKPAYFSGDHSSLGRVAQSLPVFQRRTFVTCWCKIATGWLPFLSPSQQCRSTEGI